MVLGHDEQRPTEKNYLDFMERLVNGLENLGDNKLSLMLYGSYIRNDKDIGRSDIDSVLIFPNEVIIDKKSLCNVSKVLCESLQEKNHMMRNLFQVAPLDIATMSDGRFNSFTDNFCDYFKSEGEIVFGEDYRDEMICLSKKTGIESAISHNLRKNRQSLLFSEYDKIKDYKRFLEGFLGTLNAVSRGSKEILFLDDGALRRNRFSALKELPKYFPNLDIDPLERIKDLYDHPENLDKLYKNPVEVIKFWNISLTFFEQVIKSYIEKFPVEITSNQTIS